VKISSLAYVTVKQTGRFNRRILITGIPGPCFGDDNFWHKIHNSLIDDKSASVIIRNIFTTHTRVTSYGFSTEV
jgi:hypothetical protein